MNLLQNLLAQTCECGKQKKEEIAAQHDFQGGYCERCGEYEFEKHIEIKVFTDLVEFGDYCVARCKQTITDTYNYDTVKGSFENSITVEGLLHSKSKYHNYNIVVEEGVTICYKLNNGSLDHLEPTEPITEKPTKEIVVLVEVK